MLTQPKSSKVIKVSPLDSYRLKLIFENEEIRIFDVTPYLTKGIFVELQDPNYFRQVKPFFGGVQWPNEQDFSRDTLYLLSHPAPTPS
ncbi:MAG: DUF2442 domain-containing protein [Synechococcales cyanobacterium RM1_1_8]|nr:DUF2442 domain-containing protein [Synechococcales cyanobacterium RM1_1_8]NJR70724.1 DUF2442 domain-containing protein [Synechococcales cyanobacterium CRU_2_2]